VTLKLHVYWDPTRNQHARHPWYAHGGREFVWHWDLWGSSDTREPLDGASATTWEKAFSEGMYHLCTYTEEELLRTREQLTPP
jgi:hypothetical protein